MRLKLIVVEDRASGKGIVQIIEDKSPMKQPIIGFISFDNTEKRDFYVKALIKDGRFGEVL